VEITLAALVLVDPQGRTLLLPPPKPGAKSITTKDVAALLSRMWHFPTVRAQHDPLAELQEFVNGEILAGQELPKNFQALAKVRHAVTFRKITLFPFRLAVTTLPRLPQAKSFPLSDLSGVPVSNLTRKVARAALAAGEAGRAAARSQTRHIVGRYP
jgi:hypothetical protein